MTEEVPNVSGPTDDNPKLNEVRADIAATRAELQETVDAIGAKLDMKQRSKESLAAAQTKAKHAAIQVKNRAAASPKQLAAAGGAAVAGIAGVLTLRARRRRRKAARQLRKARR